MSDYTSHGRDLPKYLTMQPDAILETIFKKAARNENVHWDKAAWRRLEAIFRTDTMTQDDISYFRKYTELTPEQPQTRSQRWFSSNVERVTKWEWPENVGGQEDWNREDKESFLDLPGGGKLTRLTGPVPNRFARVGKSIARRWLEEKRFEDHWTTALWPARSKADFRRRTRLADTMAFAEELGMLPQVIEWVLDYTYGMDLTFVRNLLNAWLIFGDGWLDWWNELGAWNQGVEHYWTVAKWVNDVLKSQPSTEDTLLYAESKTLGGYMFTSGLEDFDIVAEAKVYADGGTQRGLFDDPRVSFEYNMATMDAEAEPLLEPLSFEQFVARPDLWATTTGASTHGRVEVSFGEWSGSFKARKNLLPWVMSDDELIERALSADAQINVLLLKEELAKVRLAVGGDIWNYLLMTWLSYFVNKAYLQWPGNTINETLTQEHARFVTMWRTAKMSWVMSFDFEGFERQPTTWELQLLAERIFRLGGPNVPVEFRDQWNQVIQQVVHNFENATLVLPSYVIASVKGGKHEDEEFSIKGGLMSGLELTSKIGNAWNMTVFTMAKSILSRLGVTDPTFVSWIRGDDTFAAASGRWSGWAYLTMLRVVLQAIGAKGGRGKYGIKRGDGEFLRVNFSAQGLRGYPIRSIAGLSAQKPWSNTPWSVFRATEGVREAAFTISRRGYPLAEKFLAVVVRRLAARHKIHYNWLSLPTSMGGAGLVPWNYALQRRGRFAEVDVDALAVSVTPDSVTRWADQLPLWLQLGPMDAPVQDVVRKIVTTDDVPSVNRELRRRVEFPETTSWLDWAPDVAPVEATRWSQLRVMLSTLPVEMPWSELSRQMIATYFGRFKTDIKEWQQYSAISRHYGVGWKDWLQHHPEWELPAVKLASRKLSRGLVVDWLMGSYPVTVPSKLSSQLSWVARAAAVDILDRRIARGRKFRSGQHFKATAYYWLSLATEAVIESPLSKTIYSY